MSYPHKRRHNQYTKKNSPHHHAICCALTRPEKHIKYEVIAIKRFIIDPPESLIPLFINNALPH